MLSPSFHDLRWFIHDHPINISTSSHIWLKFFPNIIYQLVHSSALSFCPCSFCTCFICSTKYAFFFLSMDFFLFFSFLLNLIVGNLTHFLTYWTKHACFCTHLSVNFQNIYQCQECSERMPNALFL